ncbi:MAG: hypothetical protein LLG04_10715 [Parachlamydia sp.]|nr:hypothetical protein [Parachlamydia sp.]
MEPAVSLSIHPCTVLSEQWGEGANEVNHFIDKTTTPDEFDTKVSSVAGYQLENGGRLGWNALRSAAAEGNVKLVKHILTKGDPNKLVNLGNTFGCTPLYRKTSNDISGRRPKKSSLTSWLTSRRCTENHRS